MPDATFTFRVEDELKAAFTAAAKAHDRTGAQLLRDFMRDYVGRQGTSKDMIHGSGVRCRQASKMPMLAGSYPPMR